jgi:hypothetical protein
LNTSIEAKRASDLVPGVLSTDLSDTLKLGDILAKSGFFSETREAAQAVTKILAGRELGIPPVAAMTGIYIVKGKVSLSSNLIAAQIKRSGKYNYRVTFEGNKGCSIEFFENGKSVGKSAFTEADAQAAQLTGNDTWKKFPRNMLFARALSNGARWYCPDVFSGPVYTPDELGLPVNEEGEVIEGQVHPALPEPPTLRIVAPQTGEILPPEVVAYTNRFVRKAEALGMKKPMRRQYVEAMTGKSNSIDLTAGEWEDIAEDLEAYANLGQVQEFLDKQPQKKLDLSHLDHVDGDISPDELAFDPD